MAPGALKWRNPTTMTWEQIAVGAGSPGPAGPTGPSGPTGPAGPAASVLDDLLDVDTTTTAPVAGDTLVFDGVVWNPAVPAKSSYRESVTVADPAVPFLVTHGLGTDVLSVTVISRGATVETVWPSITFPSVNSVEITVQGGVAGTYDVLVLNGGLTTSSMAAAAGSVPPSHRRKAQKPSDFPTDRISRKG